MAIDVFQETVLTFAEAVKRLPNVRGAKPIAYSTIFRWRTDGLKAVDGTIVRLEAVKIGSTACTSLEALQRFFDRLQAERPDDSKQSTGFSESPPTRPVTAAESSLEQKKRFRGADRRLRICGMDGDGRIFATSPVSKERLCDLHEFLHDWMPCDSLHAPRAFLGVRSGIFAHAVSILEGKVGRKSSLEAAKDWIRSLDLLTYDVRQLDGVGPGYEAEWLRLRETPEIKALVARQGERIGVGNQTPGAAS